MARQKKQEQEVTLNPKVVNVLNPFPPELSEKAQAELKAAWLAGKISDKVMDELDPEGLIEDDEPDDEDEDN